MDKPSLSNFNLSKIKLISGGGLALKYELQAVIGANTYGSVHNEESTKHPHPDLVECLEKMAPMVAQIFGYTTAKDIAYRLDFKGDAKQKELLGNYVYQMTEKIGVTGIAISGKGDKIGVLITSSFTVDNKQKVALNTPRIMLKAKTRGFEEELEGLFEKIKSEAYKFLFENKVANPEMFGPEDFGKKVQEKEEPQKLGEAV